MLLFALIVGVPVGYVFSIDFFKVLAVSLALATLVSLHPLLDAGWFGNPLGMMEIGLIAATLVWLVFGTAFFTVFALSLVLGILTPFLAGKEGREELRKAKEQEQKEEREAREREQQRQQATKKVAEQERLKREQEQRSYKLNHQDNGSGRTVPVRPHELRAMPYEEYLQTPHWKRKRENKLRAAGRRCQVCNRSSIILNVHHRTYDRLGEELDEDLTVLCRECHRVFHENRRLGR